ncbi:MAG: roadblock/LC7 domain-containing protein [Trueperaceae bacterium]|nr:roadblock/LC7 domain-containing protein [Trueperaceae bacterium]
MLEPSLDLYGSTYDTVDGILRELLARSRARYALIIDHKGFVLMHARALWAPKPPSFDSFATLVASNYAANRAIAHLFGEDGFKETVQQGAEVGTYIEELGAEALLVTVFDTSAQLGRVKIATKHAADAVRAALEGATEAPPTVEFDAEFQQGAAALLDGLFGTRQG